MILLFCLNVSANSDSDLSNILNQMNSLTGKFKQKVVDKMELSFRKFQANFFLKNQIYLNGIT